MVILFKDNKGIIITKAFQKILDEYHWKPNKIWADTGSEFCNRSMKSWLEKIATEMYSTYNKRKLVRRFIRT